jgi:hypothetical protein
MRRILELLAQLLGAAIVVAVFGAYVLTQWFRAARPDYWAEARIEDERRRRGRTDR